MALVVGNVGILTENSVALPLFYINVTIVKTRQRLRPSSVRPGPMVRVSGALRVRRCDTASWWPGSDRNL